MSPFLLQFFSNAWWGKCFGAFFGYLIAGNMGAIVGIIIGNFFDKGITKHLSRPYPAFHYEPSDNTKKIFLEGCFTLLGYIAKADGVVSKKAIHYATQIMQQLNLSKLERSTAQENFRKGKAPHFNPEKILQTIFKITFKNRALLQVFVSIQYEAAMQDHFTPHKKEALNYIFKQLGLAPVEEQFRFYQDFSESVFSRSRHHRQERSQSHTHNHTQPCHTTLMQAYTMLGVSPEATQAEVKRAYRKCISRSHPDRLIARNSPEHEVKAANEKTQYITRAYEQICTAKGW